MPLKILAIDDEPDTLDLLKLRFEKEISEDTYQFIYASSGQEGISKLFENQIDLALVDLRMPVMDGVEFLERTQELFPELLCVVVSAFNDMGNLRQAMRNGAFDFVCKPVDFADLKSTIIKAERFITRQQLARRTRDSLLAVMNHELRTPLNGVIGMADFVATQVQDPFVAESLEVIRQSGHSLLDIFTEMLDFSTSAKPDSIQKDETFVLQDFCNTLYQLYRPTAQLGKKELQFSVDKKIPPKLLGDKLHLSQILTHLISNALKFSPPNSKVELTAKLLDVPLGRPLVRFEVKDQGRGIAADHLNDIFEPFFQVDSSMTRAEGGLGLGLSIAKTWVQRLGGQLQVESQLGSGSRFWFDLSFRSG